MTVRTQPHPVCGACSFFNSHAGVIARAVGCSGSYMGRLPNTDGFVRVVVGSERRSLAHATFPSGPPRKDVDNAGGKVVPAGNNSGTALFRRHLFVVNEFRLIILSLQIADAMEEVKNGEQVKCNVVCKISVTGCSNNQKVEQALPADTTNTAVLSEAKVTQGSVLTF